MKSKCDKCGEVVADIDAGFSPGVQGMKHECGGTWRVMPRSTYRAISEARLPDGLRWDVPPECQGQIIEVAYADERPLSSVACRGSRYRRTTDRSIGFEAHEYAELADE